jgi:hypothetical protein
MNLLLPAPAWASVQRALFHSWYHRRPYAADVVSATTRCATFWERVHKYVLIVCKKIINIFKEKKNIYFWTRSTSTVRLSWRPPTLVRYRNVSKVVGMVGCFFANNLGVRNKIFIQKYYALKLKRTVNNRSFSFCMYRKMYITAWNLKRNPVFTIQQTYESTVSWSI